MNSTTNPLRIYLRLLTMALVCVLLGSQPSTADGGSERSQEVNVLRVQLEERPGEWVSLAAVENQIVRFEHRTCATSRPMGLSFQVKEYGTADQRISVKLLDLTKLDDGYEVRAILDEAETHLGFPIFFRDLCLGDIFVDKILTRRLHKQVATSLRMPEVGFRFSQNTVLNSCDERNGLLLCSCGVYRPNSLSCTVPCC